MFVIVGVGTSVSVRISWKLLVACVYKLNTVQMCMESGEGRDARVHSYGSLLVSTIISEYTPPPEVGALPVVHAY